MKIFHVLTHFMPEHIGGTEIYVHSLQQHLQIFGYSGGVIIPTFKKRTNLEYEYNEVNVYTYTQDKGISDSLQKGLDPPSGLKHFENLLDKLQPDILHFHEISGSNGITIFHIKAAEERRIPIVFTMHLVGYVCATGTLLRNFKEKCSGLIEKYNCTRCSFIHQGIPYFGAEIATTVSSLVNKSGIHAYNKKGKIFGLLGRYEMLQNHKEKLEIIASNSNIIVCLNRWFAEMLVSNGVLESKIKVIEQASPIINIDFADSKLKEVQKSDILKLIFVGRIYPAKGLHLLLESLKEISSTKYTLDIYGPYDDIVYFNKCRNLTNGNDKIQFCGTIVPGETITHLKKYDLLCLPSVVTEMSPLIIQEAFTAGIPVLASNVYGNSASIMHMINGLMFDVGNSQDLSKKIQLIIDKPELLIKLKHGISPRNTFKDVCRSYTAIYNAVIKNA